MISESSWIPMETLEKITSRLSQIMIQNLCIDDWWRLSWITCCKCLRRWLAGCQEPHAANLWEDEWQVVMNQDEGKNPSRVGALSRKELFHQRLDRSIKMQEILLKKKDGEEDDGSWPTFCFRQNWLGCMRNMQITLQTRKEDGLNWAFMKTSFVSTRGKKSLGVRDWMRWWWW